MFLHLHFEVMEQATVKAFLTKEADELLCETMYKLTEC